MWYLCKHVDVFQHQRRWCTAAASCVVIATRSDHTTSSHTGSKYNLHDSLIMGFLVWFREWSRALFQRPRDTERAGRWDGLHKEWLCVWPLDDPSNLCMYRAGAEDWETSSWRTGQRSPDAHPTSSLVRKKNGLSLLEVVTRPTASLIWLFSRHKWKMIA